MSNPQTDQYAAEVRERRADTADTFTVAIADAFADRAPHHMPNLDPAVIGEVMLHVGAGLGGVALALHHQGIDTETIVGTLCNILAIAGAKLYSPEQEMPHA